MKVSTKSLFTFLLASSVFLSATDTAAGVVEPPETDPCIEKEIEENDDKECFGLNEACSVNEEGCCGNYVCAGFNFFKKCVEPIVCHEMWHDCSDGIGCCDDMKCTVMDHGKLECQNPKIGTRTVEVGDFDIVEEPTDPPPPPNVITTKKEPVEIAAASSSGDPHIKTFDGLKYDCQGHGEHILAKSLVTRREVQARYEHMSTGKPISIAKGVAVQDEGDTPLVQVSVATLDGTLGNDMGDGCKLLFFVDRQQKDLEENYDDGKVSVTRQDRKINIVYAESEMSVEIRYFKCRMNIFVRVPTSDLVVGVLGTNNKNAKDEWMLLDGSVMEIPSTGGKLRKPGYDFCTKHCNKDPQASLFTYIETGVDFQTYERCDLPYGNTLDKYLNDVPQWVIDICGAHDFACIMDVSNGDATDAIELRQAELVSATICSPPGGSCDERKCCGNSKCVAFGGLAGSVCDGDVSLGVPELGSCKNNPKCQEGLTCVPLENGDAQCRLDLPCQLEWMSCDGNEDCCDNSVCMENANTGIKQCRKLPSCMKQWDDCSVVGCCGSLKCVQEGARKTCMDVPGCWNQQNKDCTTIPCCGDLTCIQDDGGRNLCKKLPVCAKKNQSCQWTPCCEDPANPMQCVEITDHKGRQSKQCQLAPGGAEIFVFDDTNGNGIQDAGETGIQGVELQLVDNKKKPFAEDKVNGGNIHEVLTTDVNGIVSFKSVPKDTPVRVMVVKPPTGGIATRSRQGKDRSKDSDLYTNMSGSFQVKGVDVYKDTALGFLMPIDVEIEVFNDLNSNGIRDAEDGGIKGVKLRLEASTQKNPKFHPMANLENGGNGHESLVTDGNGKVVFTKIPQNMKLRVKVLEAPEGAIPTRSNAGGNDELDSDLSRDGYSYHFYTKGDDDGYLTKVDLGYRMPETVIVRVWDDTNGDGKQDMGEIGIKDVKLQLVDYNQNKPLANSGGNSHLAVLTDADGLATFTKVPQEMKLRVKVLERPDGAIKTKSNQGNDDKDSDLDKDDLSGHFTLTSGGAPFTSLDLGYKLAGSMVVRVWDDENGNGLQDDGEAGLKGVKLCLVEKNTKKRLTNTGGNSHLDVETDESGYAAFTGVPQGKDLRVKVIDQPAGAIRTSQNQGKDAANDSDLGSDGYSDHFRMSAGDYTEIDLGFKMPEQVVVRVWDDENSNGRQDEGEVGIQGVELRLVSKNSKKNLQDTGAGGNSHEAVTTDENGNAVFTMVPKGIDIRVKITNAPKGAVLTRSNQGSDDKDSDFGTDNFSSHFNLSNFVGSTFSSIDLGFKMPTDVQVRVWDDVNLNGIQDAGEPGVEGVKLQLIKDSGRKPLEGYATQTTDENGFVTFPKVTKATKIRVKVLNFPDGAAVTTKNQKKNGGNEGNDSDFNFNDKLTDAFDLSSFATKVVGVVDIGFRMPDDMEIKVWDDVNGNGIQEEDEPGIAGVEIQLVKDSGKKPLTSIGGGSNAHEKIKTGPDGIAKFVKVPKATRLRAKVLNAPKGSTYTTKADHRKTDATEDTDSDLNRDMMSDSFSLSSFAGDGPFGAIDLGFRMPKTMVVRAWNDANENGIQDDGEEDLQGVKIKILQRNGKALPKQGPNSNAHLEQTTDETGRVIFKEVPQGIDMKIKVTKKPNKYKKVTRKRQGRDRQLDSDLNSNMYSDTFKLPSNVEENYDQIDLGFVLQ